MNREHPLFARQVDTAALVAQLAVVGAMVGSLVAIRASLQNEFVAGGALVGSFVGWQASRSRTAMGLFAWSVLVGVGYGVILFAPLAAEMDDPVLYASGVSIGVFLALPLFALTLPAFKAGRRAKRARESSILRSADALATWAGSCLAIGLLGLAGQPVVMARGRPVDLSLAFVVLAAVACLAVVVFDVRTWAALRRRQQSQASDGGAATSAPRDVGLGTDVFEERVPASNPFRSVDKVTLVTVGSVALARRALERSFGKDVMSLAVCAAVLAWKTRAVFGR